MKSFFVFIFISLSISQLFADEKKIFVVLDDSFPPYSWIDNNKKVQGLYPTITEIILKNALGISNYEMRLYPWKRGINMLENSEAIVSGIYKTEEREKSFLYTDAFFKEKLVVYSLKESNIEFSTIQDFKNKSIGINMGWVISSEFENLKKNNFFKVQAAKHSEDNFKKLEHKRIDYFIADEINGDYTLMKLKIAGKFKKHSTPLITNDSYMAISKKFPNAEGVIESINTSIKSLKNDKIIEKTINDFFQDFILSKENFQNQ